MKRWLDYFFISNSFQEYVHKTDVPAAFSTDHSPLVFSLGLNQDENRGNDFLKTNNSLKTNSAFITKLKK